MLRSNLLQILLLQAVVLLYQCVVRLVVATLGGVSLGIRSGGGAVGGAVHALGVREIEDLLLNGAWDRCHSEFLMIRDPSGFGLGAALVVGGGVARVVLVRPIRIVALAAADVLGLV